MMADEGLDFIVEDDRVRTRGRGVIGRPDLMMRAATASEVEHARHVLLRLVGFVVSCGASIHPGDTFTIDNGDVTLEAAGRDLLEVVRNEG